MLPIHLRLFILAAMLLTTLCSPPLSAQDKSETGALNQQLQEINELTGDRVSQTQVRLLAKDKKAAKRLVRYAQQQLKANPKAVTYNGAWVLSQVAQGLELNKEAAQFYRICANRAAKLESTQKLLNSYGGLMVLYYQSKDYKKTAEVCKEFLALRTGPKVPRVVRMLAKTPDGELEFVQDFNYDSAARLRPGVYVLLVKTISKQGDFKKALDLAEKLVKVDDGWQFRVVRATVLREAGKLKEAAEAYDELIQLVGKDKKLDNATRGEQQDEFRFILSKIYTKLGRIEKAVEQLKTLSQRNPGDPTYVIWLAESLIQQKNYKQALALTSKLIEQRKHWRFRAIHAAVLQDAGQLKEAARFYEDLIEEVRNDENLSPDEKGKEEDRFRSVLSNIYPDIGQVNKAIEQLERLIQRHPTEPTYYNNLGYFMADHDIQLEKAEQYIRKALIVDKKRRAKLKDLKPEDDHDSGVYLDSLGWVLFKQKKYMEAKKVLLEAVKYKDGKHVEIYDHLGDVLHKLGETDAALEAWKTGVTVAGSSRRDEETKKQVEAKIKKYSK
ncbi:MAG: tetratricopeptide repeat protein [Gemmataceae bacterium]